MDEIEEILGGLSLFNDNEIGDLINDDFKDDPILADLDASGICILLTNKKNVLTGQETTSFDMESF